MQICRKATFVHLEILLPLLAASLLWSLSLQLPYLSSRSQLGKASPGSVELSAQPVTPLP